MQGANIPTHQKLQLLTTKIILLLLMGTDNSLIHRCCNGIPKASTLSDSSGQPCLLPSSVIPSQHENFAQTMSYPLPHKASAKRVRKIPIACKGTVLMYPHLLRAKRSKKQLFTALPPESTGKRYSMNPIKRSFA